mgnify:CR=1 FL=1
MKRKPPSRKRTGRNPQPGNVAPCVAADEREPLATADRECSTRSGGRLHPRYRTFDSTRHSSYAEQVEHALRDAIVRGRSAARHELVRGGDLDRARHQPYARRVRRSRCSPTSSWSSSIRKSRRSVAPVRRSLIDEGTIRAQHTRMRQPRRAREPPSRDQQLDFLAASIARAAQAAAAAATPKRSSSSTRQCIARCSEFAGRAHVWTHACKV